MLELTQSRPHPHLCPERNQQTTDPKDIVHFKVPETRVSGVKQTS